MAQSARHRHECPRTVSRAESRALCAELGIDAAWLKASPLPFQPEARRLAYVGLGTDGRDKFLSPGAARAWAAMQRDAEKAGVALLLISAFRSQAFQARLIAQKLARGERIADVLCMNAAPGYSEHHGGGAVDIGCAGVAALDAAFEHTAAFAWLQQHAARYKFFLSYPRGNALGIGYEPWHWCWHPERP